MLAVEGKIDCLIIPKNLGDSITADHSIINEDDQSRSADRVALIVQDRATYWSQGYPAPTKTVKKPRRLSKGSWDLEGSLSTVMQMVQQSWRKPKTIWNG